jgi:hypothetical protein
MARWNDNWQGGNHGTGGKNTVPLSFCTPQIPHGLPIDRPGLRISSENNYEAGGGLSMAVWHRHLPDDTRNPPRIGLGTRRINVSYFNLENAHVGYIKIGLTGRLVKTWNGLKWIRTGYNRKFLLLFWWPFWFRNKEFLGQLENYKLSKVHPISWMPMVH